MATIFFRTLIIYLALIVTMRLMGKRQIGELEVTDLVTTLLISEIAALPITNREIPVILAVIPMITLLMLEVLSSWLLIRFPKMRALVSASPTVIIQKGRLDQNALRDLRISPEELMSEIRQTGLTSLDQVDCAILEKNGKLTVLPKACCAPPSAEALGVRVRQEELMHVVFYNGSFNGAGLRLIGKNRAWLARELEKRELCTDDLFCVTANEGGALFWLCKEKKMK